MNREKQHDSRIALRLPNEQKSQLSRLIAQGEFKNLSQVIRAAISEFLMKGTGDGELQNELRGRCV